MVVRAGRTAEFHLPPTAHSVPQARRHVHDTLSEWSLDDIVDVATLLTSEVVTNAVLHARTTITMTIELEDGHVRICIADASPVVPALRHHSDTATTGRGLQLIESLADSWDIDGHANGKTVWFRVSTEGDPWKSGDSQELEGAGA